MGDEGGLGARRPQHQEDNDCTLVVSEEGIKELWRGQAGATSSTTFYIMGRSAEDSTQAFLQPPSWIPATYGISMASQCYQENQSKLI